MLVSIALLFTGLRKLAISRQMQFFSGNVNSLLGCRAMQLACSMP
jgi:hypothetical protein